MAGLHQDLLLTRCLTSQDQRLELRMPVVQGHHLWDHPIQEINAWPGLKGASSGWLRHAVAAAIAFAFTALIIINGRQLRQHRSLVQRLIAKFIASTAAVGNARQSSSAGSDAGALPTVGPA